MVHAIIDTLRQVDYRLVVEATQFSAHHYGFDVFVYICAELLIMGFPFLLLVLWESPELKGSQHGSKKAVIMALMSLVAALAVKSMVALVYFRLRPFVNHPDLLTLGLNAHDGSFPSGHALVSFSIAYSLVLSGYRRVGWWAMGAALLISLGRVFAGVHYPSDIIAGAVIGMTAAWYLHREASSLKRYLPNH